MELEIGAGVRQRDVALAASDSLLMT